MATSATSSSNQASSASSTAQQQPATTQQSASQSIRRNSDKVGRVDVNNLVKDVKASSPDVQAQRDFAAAAAKQIENRSDRQAFVKALEDQGVARKPGFFERQWQGAKGLATGVYEGGSSLVGGVYELGKMGVKGTVETAKFGYNYATDGQYRDKTNAAVGDAARATVDATGKGLSAAGNYAADRIADPSKLGQDAQAVGSAVRTGVDAVGKKADQIYDNFDKARSEAVIQGTTDELAGKIVGRTGFEVGSMLIPVSKLGALGKGASLAPEAGALVKGADATMDANKLVKGAEVAGDANKVVQGEKSLANVADQALARTGDTPARVARVEKEAKVSADSAVTNARQTGAASGQIDAADKAYEAIRASTTDVAAIAKNTGLKPENIQKVKDHLFINEHRLDRYESLGIPAEIKRFDSNANIAEAWKRLVDGTHTPKDIALLKHETAEAWHMRTHGSGYNEAHNAADRRFPASLE